MNAIYDKERLSSLLEKLPHADYPVNSRVHPLRSFGDNCFVKRDDELGFGISGSKFRKYRFLVPFLRTQGYKRICVIGGTYSNNVLSITQLLIENGLEPILFLRGEKPAQLVGNFLLLSTLISGASIHWVSKDEWHRVDEIASEYAKTIENAYVISEGAQDFLAFLGALTLPLDIIRNEEHLGLSFDRIFIDVGTGLTASALLLGFQYLQKEIEVHLLHLADDEEDFKKRLSSFQVQFENWVQEAIPFPEFITHTPTLAPSFGSTNKAIFRFIKLIAQQEGFFLDPIYSAKLFHESKLLMESSSFTGNTLIIHSGGALTLLGFQKQLEGVNSTS